MKILHIVPTYIPAYEYGGPIESVHALNKGLIGCNVETTVYTTDLGIKETPPTFWQREGRIDESRDVDGVRVFYFPVSNRLREYSVMMKRKLNELKEGDFDLIHITSVFLSASKIGSFYAKENNIPYVISPRGSLMEAPLRNSAFKKKIYIEFFEKKYLKNASGIHFTSEQEKDEYFNADLPRPRGGNVCVVPNPVDTFSLSKTSASDFRNKFNISKEKKIVLFLGRINWKKGFDTLIPAWRLVLRDTPNVCLVIAGPDEKNYLSDVKHIIQHEGIEEASILFTGMLMGEEKMSALRDSDIFVLPSYSENFGMAVAEAMYFRKPVVITPQVGIANLVKQEGAGIVVEKDAKLFADGILGLIKNDELRQKMGERGHAIVINQFSPGVIGKKMYEFYEKVIKNSKK